MYQVVDVISFEESFAIAERKFIPTTDAKHVS